MADLVSRLGSRGRAATSRPSPGQATAAPGSHPARRGIGHRLAGCAALAAALAACGTPGPTIATRTPVAPAASPTPAPGTSLDLSTPAGSAAATGSVRITVIPQQPQVDSTITYLDAAGQTLGTPTVFAANQIAEVVRTFPVGKINLTMDGVDCDGSIEVVADQEADVLGWINWFEDPRCLVEATRTHPAGEAHSADKGQLIVEAAPGADVRITPLDVAGATLAKGPRDVAGYVAFVELAAGWYEVSLMNGEMMTFRTPVELGVDAANGIDIVVPPPAVPLTCVEIDRRPCEAAMLEAWSYGLFPRSQQVGEVAGITVGPTSTKTCSSEPGSVNELEVTFDFAAERSRVIQMTRTARGYLHPCPAY